jgi:subtilisin family serine protease
MHANPLRFSTLLIAALSATAALSTYAAQPGTTVSAAPSEAQPSRYIVQAATSHDARRNVIRVHATIGQELELIRAVSAYLTPKQVAQLRHMHGVRVFADRPLSTSGLNSLLTNVTSQTVSLVNGTTTPLDSTLASNPLVGGTVMGQVAYPLVSTLVSNPLVSSLTSPIVQAASSSTALQDGSGAALLSLLYQTSYPMLVGADTLHKAGITGNGITIAVLDTGFWQDVSQNYGSRVLATIDVRGGGSAPVKSDPYGHGTHVTAIAASGAQNLGGGYLGVAPKANLVIVRAFDGYGGGRYTDVIAGLN